MYTKAAKIFLFFVLATSVLLEVGCNNKKSSPPANPPPPPPPVVPAPPPRAVPPPPMPPGPNNTEIPVYTQGELNKHREMILKVRDRLLRAGVKIMIAEDRASDGRVAYRADIDATAALQGTRRHYLLTPEIENLNKLSALAEQFAAKYSVRHRIRLADGSISPRTVSRQNVETMRAISIGIKQNIRRFMPQ